MTIDARSQVRVREDSANLAVFLGLYEAERYKDRISRWLGELDLSDTHLFVVDNNSLASPESWIVPLLIAKGAEFTFVRNEQNYGGYGSLIKNLNLLEKYVWVTTLHQDDLYSSNHVQEHIRISKEAGPRLGMICTEPISETLDGKEIALPRGNWFLSSTEDSVEFFLAHLRNHIFPFSGATFRTAVLTNYPVPWHSTAFPDTEVVMKMAPDFNVIFASGHTVRYFENPYSESHSLSASQRDFGVFQALIRVFTHESYAKICGLVAESDRQRFLESLVAGIDVRFKDKVLAEIFRQTALELTATHFGAHPTLYRLLIEGYRKVGDISAVSALSGLSESQIESGETSNLVAAGDAITRVNLHYKLSSALLTVIPRRFRAPLAKAIMKTSIGKMVFPQWNLMWKR